MTYTEAEFMGASERANLTPDNQLDSWSFFDYKAKFRIPTHIPHGAMVPGWIGPEHQRRIRAYQLLDSFYKLCARRWVEADHAAQMDRREYGDPFLLVEAVASSVVGDHPKITVDGLLEDDPETTTSFAKECQDQLDKWADSETFFVKLRENERNAQKYGDAVWVIGWDAKKKRPRIRVYDPGFYFPVEDPESDEDYPRKVHIAYEFEIETPTHTTERWVRRLTWELREVTPYKLPWSDGDATESCFMQDRKWKLGDIEMGKDINDFSINNSVNNLAEDEVNLGVDFLPVIHTPNMATEGLWGQSVLAPVIQLLDDIVSTDTDLQSSSALTGSPVLGLGGASAPKDDDGNIKSYGPGTVYETGDGKLDLLDTSRSLDALLKNKDSLLKRMSVNARTPETLLGRVDPGQVRAGVILTLSFAPHTTMINEMREIRDVKYGLALKFVLRLYIKEGTLKAGSDDIPNIRLVPGSYLPADKQEIGTIVSQGIANNSMSLETAVELMVQAGYPIDDIEVEVKRIQSRDFKGADLLVTATNDTEAAREYLNLGPAPQGTTVVDQQQQTADMAQAALDMKNQQTNGNQPPKPGVKPVPVKK